MPSQQTTARHVTASERAGRRAPAWPQALTARGELIGYAVLWVGLATFLWSQIRQVDQYFLDEWIYAAGAEYIWDNLPGGLISGIPYWDRGPQRLYSTLLAPIWGPFGSSTAFTLSHFLNVLLLTSAIVPAALLARRVIAHPALRVLGVALAVGVPWLAIGAQMLAENLAFPLYLWAIYAIVRAADRPSLGQAVPRAGADRPDDAVPAQLRVDVRRPGARRARRRGARPARPPRRAVRDVGARDAAPRVADRGDDGGRAARRARRPGRGRGLARPLRRRRRGPHLRAPRRRRGGVDAAHHGHLRALARHRHVRDAVRARARGRARRHRGAAGAPHCSSRPSPRSPGSW